MDERERFDRWKKALSAKKLASIPTACKHEWTIWITGGRLYCMNCENILEGRSFMDEVLVPRVEKECIQGAFEVGASIGYDMAGLFGRLCHKVYSKAVSILKGRS